MTETKRQRLLDEAAAKIPIPIELQTELPYECKACGHVMRLVAKTFHEARCGRRVR